MAPDVLELAQALIERPSLTPEDGGCQALLAEILAPFGFSTESMPSGGVTNSWLRHGKELPLLVFAGHTDVVPTGPVDQWHSDPFSPTFRDGQLYGRGAADMKGSVAAMAVACAQHVGNHPDHSGSLALLLTSDEEGPSIDGTRTVVETLQSRGDIPTWCVVGEPSCQRQLGDTIKIGRRGTLSGHLVIHGQQGHIAYPQLCDNPIHRFAPVLQELVAVVWDHGNNDFPPTHFQISNIHAGTGANNIIPSELAIDFNLRYSTEVTAAQLQERIEQILTDGGLQYRLDWQPAGEPYLTPPGQLTDACRESVMEVLGVEARLSTDGGTSDGRFIRPTGAEVAEFGPINSSIHKIDEHVAVRDLEHLVDVYRTLIAKLLN